MADGDAPGAVLRNLVAEAVDADGDAPLDGDFDLVERGDEPGPAARLAALVGSERAVVGVVPRADRALARRLPGNGDEGGDGDRAVDGGGDRAIRLVFTGRAADRLTGPAGTAVRSVLAERGIDAYRHDGDSPLGVLLVGDRAVVGLFDEDGLAALLWSDAPAVREWAAATCRRYLSAAEPA
ncbi:hypothetical protein [Halorubrum sp. CSM-61]|uniref:transcriptional regulator FilR1 domain-containing protein n=1 Tax=Halorubrum sp. CSM-61 TaxID=2485838 RepID=UPI000F4B01B7|nr:hypothetical protein [Halorubrum sp. CSM-61]